MLFQGEEWGATAPFQYFTDHAEAELAQAVRDGRRREFARFGWEPERIPDPQDHATFERSKLDWRELEKPDHAELFEWYRRLIELRRRHAALSDPRLDSITVDCDEARETLVVRRRDFGVLVNLGAEPSPFAFDGEVDVLMSSAPTSESGGSVIVPADSCAVVLVH
jgi:maltooligosyltrehalose trehalohydrolase